MELLAACLFFAGRGGVMTNNDYTTKCRLRQKNGDQYSQSCALDSVSCTEQERTQTVHINDHVHVLRNLYTAGTGVANSNASL
eukprot:363625-Chlamydomonas_euryale.AAC.7